MTGEMVREFHRAFGLPHRDRATWVPIRVLHDLRIDLLREEFEEYLAGEAAGDLVAVSDALADMVYVAYGTAVTYGIDLDAVLAEVHRSNMSKLGPDGRPVLRADGKVLKGPGYEPPDIAHVLAGGQS